jgi:hypothetical protein
MNLYLKRPAHPPKHKNPYGIHAWQHTVQIHSPSYFRIYSILHGKYALATVFTRIVKMLSNAMHCPCTSVFNTLSQNPIPRSLRGQRLRPCLITERLFVSGSVYLSVFYVYLRVLLAGNRLRVVKTWKCPELYWHTLVKWRIEFNVS